MTNKQATSAVKQWLNLIGNELIPLQKDALEYHSDPKMALRYLTFIMEHWPDAVIEYLKNEQEHFARLERQAENAGFIRDLADRIYRRSLSHGMAARVSEMMQKGDAGTA